MKFDACQTVQHTSEAQDEECVAVGDDDVRHTVFAVLVFEEDHSKVLSRDIRAAGDETIFRVQVAHHSRDAVTTIIVR